MAMTREEQLEQRVRELEGGGAYTPLPDVQEQKFQYKPPEDGRVWDGEKWIEVAPSHQPPTDYELATGRA